MIMKKAFTILGICCIVVLAIVGIIISTPAKTIDFRGTVTEIKANEIETTFKISNSSIGTSYIVVADNKTKVSPDHNNDPKINLTDIKIGDTIEGDYRFLTKENKAKFITVWCGI